MLRYVICNMLKEQLINQIWIDTLRFVPREPWDVIIQYFFREGFQEDVYRLIEGKTRSLLPNRAFRGVNLYDDATIRALRIAVINEIYRPETVDEVHRMGYGV